METKIIEQKKNPLFKREEIVVEVVSDVSPSNADVAKLVAEKLSSSEDKVKIKGIYGNFGTHIFTVYANVYETVSDKEKTEIKTKKERDAEKKAEEERIKADAEARKAEKEAAKVKEESEKPMEGTEEIKGEEKTE